MDMCSFTREAEVLHIYTAKPVESSNIDIGKENDR